jgi:uncharacterized protein YdeI (YjbR/CyaY-like superfamily)
MAKVKHNPEAPALIDDYIDNMEPFAKAICMRLRQLILSADPEFIEDWKWGPNYYKNGMVCGFAAFKRHVNFVFFQGAILKDPYKLLTPNEAALYTRTIQIRNASDIDDEKYLEYIFEAIDNNSRGLKAEVPKDRKVEIPADVKKALNNAGLLKHFEAMSYSRRNVFILWINQAKKEETRTKRINEFLVKIRG